MLRNVLFIVLAALLAFVPTAYGHPGHEHEQEDRHGREVDLPALTLALADAEQPTTAPKKEKLSGQGEWKFRYRPDLSKVPVKHQRSLQLAHGGFGVDRSVPLNKRHTYFGLPGAGVIRIAPDLKSMRVLGGKKILDPEKDPKKWNARKTWNYHNTTVHNSDRGAILVLPSNNAGRVWITSDRGTLQYTFEKPALVKGDFKPTDAEVVDGTLLVPNGYADRFIYSADLTTVNNGKGWHDTRWGGKGPKEKTGVFSTSHGITAIPNSKNVTIADREHGRLQNFDAKGKFLNVIDLPGGPYACDVDYSDNGRYAVVGCLKDAGRKMPAPFFIFDNGKVVSKVIPAQLDVPNSRQIHNAAFRFLEEADDTVRCYVLVLFYSPGGYAVLERVEPMTRQELGLVQPNAKPEHVKSVPSGAP